MIVTLVAALTLFHVADTTEVLGPATIYGESRRQELMHMSVGSVEVGRNYIENHFSASLSQSLSSIPGVQARSIGNRHCTGACGHQHVCDDKSGRSAGRRLLFLFIKRGFFLKGCSFLM